MDQTRGGQSNSTGVTRSAPHAPSPGDVPSPAELFIRYANQFAGMARRRGLRGPDVEDATQVVFVAVLASIDRYDPARGTFDPWVFTVARRTLRDHVMALRKRLDQPDAVDAADPIDPGPDSEQRMEDAELYAVYLTLLDVLPPDLREVLVMADVEEISMPQIARELGISEQAGYARIRRARRLLEEAWKDRQRSATSIIPLGAFTLDHLMEIDRHGPPTDPEMNTRARARFESELRPEHGPGSLGAAGAGSGKALSSLAAFKAAGAVLLFGAGMGAGAVLHWAMTESPRALPTTVVVGAIPSWSAPRALADAPLDPTGASPGGTAPGLVPSIGVAATAPRSIADSAHVGAARPPGDDSSVAELALIQDVRAALRNNKPEEALEGLDRHRTEFKYPRLADLCEDLRRQALDLREAQKSASGAR